MEVRTFTSFWNMERKLYSFYDVALPVPVSLRVAGVFLVVALPWWGLFLLLHIPFNNPSYLFWIIPPVGLAYMATKPIFQGKTIGQFVKSMALFYIQPKKLNGFRRQKYLTNQKYQIVNRVFVRDEKMLKLDPERITP